MKLKNFNSMISFVLLLLASVFIAFGVNCLDVFAVSPFDGTDGKYSVDFDTSIPNNKMMRQVFENSEAVATVEKSNDNYYLTISLNSEVMKDFRFESEQGKVGEIVRRDGVIERHTYTVSKETLQKTMNFSLIITVNDMNRFQSFTIDLKLNSGKRIGEVDDLGERPALFQPEIILNASDVEQETGSYYLVPDATAVFNHSDIEVTKTVYYIQNGVKEIVAIKDGKILLSRIGEYQLVYRAESDQYKTSLGNNTWSEKVIRITSKLDATELVKVEDINQVLSEGYMISSSYINDGEIYNQAKERMKKTADNFEVISFTLFQKDGQKITLNESVAVYLRTNDYYDRHDVVVYHMDENGMTEEIEIENFGRYAKLETSYTGTFILCVPGVAFHMPMWGYAAIVIGAVLVVIGGVVTTIVLVKKKRKKANSQSK